MPSISGFTIDFLTSFWALTPVNARHIKNEQKKVLYVFQC